MAATTESIDIVETVTVEVHSSRRRRPPTPAEIQFNISSNYPTPQGFEAWKIRNDYPPPFPKVDVQGAGSVGVIPIFPGQLPGDTIGYPWLDIDPTKEPRKYLDYIREYCFEGNVENDFVVQDNKVGSSLLCVLMLRLTRNVRRLETGITLRGCTPRRSAASLCMA